MMTEQQKQRIAALRRMGKSYADIATALDLSRSSVKTFCQRYPVQETTLEYDGRCEQCGQPKLASIQHKRFCSDRCRITWWNRHPNAFTARSTSITSCACCGKPIRTCESKPRKYCSRACYIADRFQKGVAKQ